MARFERLNDEAAGEGLELGYGLRGVYEVGEGGLGKGTPDEVGLEEMDGPVGGGRGL